MTTPPPNDGTAHPLDFIAPQRDIWGQEHVISGEETEQAAKRILAFAAAEPEPKPQPKVKKRQKFEPEPGSRLALLFNQLPELEAAKKEAEEKLTACKKAIQAEIGSTIDNPEDLPDQFDIPADPYGGYPAYTLAAREGAWRLDAEALKNQDPATYVKWAKRGQPYWELKRKQTNRVRR